MNTLNLDRLASYLMDSSWLFLGSWVVLLLAASVAAFGRDSA